jgi:hypothetical protein
LLTPAHRYISTDEEGEGDEEEEEDEDFDEEGEEDEGEDEENAAPGKLQRLIAASTLVVHAP